MPKKTKNQKSSIENHKRYNAGAFRNRVHTVVRSIAKGSVMSYGEVARRAGAPGAARAVGTILKANFDPSIPCHRVIRSNGSLGHYNRGDKQKAIILKQEGYHTGYEKNIKKS